MSKRKLIIHLAKDHTEMHWINHKTHCGIQTPWASIETSAVNCAKCRKLLSKGLMQNARPKKLFQLQVA